MKVKSKKSYRYIIKEVEKIVKNICENEERWKYHILPVMQYGKLLAEKLNADKEVVELACLLHDLARIKGDIKNHHIASSKEAEKILRRFGYDNKKINKIRSCIYKHRGSINLKKNNIEEEIVASADAMAHFSFAITLFYSAFGRRKLSLEDGITWISKKTERSWNKISIPIAKKIVLNRYKEIKNILSYKNNRI